MIVFLNADHTKTINVHSGCCIHSDKDKAIIIFNKKYLSKSDLKKIDHGWVKNIQIGMDKDYKVSNYTINDNTIISCLSEDQLLIKLFKEKRRKE